MAPKISSSLDNSGPFVERVEENNKQEIFYNGYFYDVTDFVDRHPGGNVIKFYTEKGEDATQAIEQFHYRFKHKVDLLLKSFKKRPALQSERGLEEKALTRHEALSKDFKKLFEELQEEGYFEPDVGHVFLRLWECAAITVLAYAVFFQLESIWTKFLGTIFVGFAYSRFGWLQHEGGHNSLTGTPWIDKAIQAFAGCFVLGGSAVWWNSQHNRHHAMPQRLNHDVDLATLPYVAFHKRTVQESKDINNFFVRYQALFYFTLDLFVIVLAWRIVLHPRYQIHKKAYIELLLDIPCLFLIYNIGFMWAIWISFWFAFFLGINFALNHSHLEVADKPTHWIEYSLTHTANITSSLLVDWFMGYLNYQIEHHLFPAMPQFKQKEISHRVKALAEKHGLPYRTFSYPQACKLALKNLNDVGMELTSTEYFKS